GGGGWWPGTSSISCPTPSSSSPEDPGGAVPRTTLVRQVMTTDVLTFRLTDTVETAAKALSERHLGGAPVVDDDGRLIGLIEDDDLIVQEARIHFPTVVSVLGAYLELPSSASRMETELRKAVGSSVGDVMDPEPPTCSPDDSLETVATIMHERAASRLPVIEDGRLVGIVSRGDLVRDIAGSFSQADAATASPPLGGELGTEG
ncbi:MAG TPA: CBS domain-containing protein, partial [Acidimicrobiales bacterium]|nr:CBS domain-containing protein [Acidimicrobiales bacterium]